MQFSELANELVLQIFQSCTSVQDMLALASTSRHFHSLLSPARRIPILYIVAESEYGPLSEAVQVITYNHSQPTHEKRTLPETLHNLKSLMKVGKIAKQWEGVYPEKKWKDNYVERRSLTSEECFRLRRAVYRLWLYSTAFHNEHYTRTGRRLHKTVFQRAALLRNWSTPEIADIEDLRLIIRAVLEDDICPSNATVQNRLPRQSAYAKHRALANARVTNAFAMHFHQYGQYRAQDPLSAAAAAGEPNEEGWGDEISHYYVLEDMMKLTPGQVCWLRQNAPLKSMVEAFKASLGNWFDNNGDTFGETAHFVCHERESESWLIKGAENLRGLVLTGWLGIVQEVAEDVAASVEKLEL